MKKVLMVVVMLLMGCLFVAPATAQNSEQDRANRRAGQQQRIQRQRGQQDRRRRQRPGDANALKPGDMAPTFKLKSLDGKSETDLSEFKGKKPVLLFFGSYT